LLGLSVRSALLILSPHAPLCTWDFFGIFHFFSLRARSLMTHHITCGMRNFLHVSRISGCFLCMAGPHIRMAKKKKSIWTQMWRKHAEIRDTCRKFHMPHVMCISMQLHKLSFLTTDFSLILGLRKLEPPNKLVPLKNFPLLIVLGLLNLVLPCMSHVPVLTTKKPISHLTEPSTSTPPTSGTTSPLKPTHSRTPLFST
jgi:hypothetical protein